MKRLSKEKKQQLFLAVLVTAMALGCIWFFLIKAQRESLRRMDDRRTVAAQKVEQFKNAINRADQVEQELCEARKQLEKIEDNMATGDLYSWVINSVKGFKLGYKVEIPQFSQIDGPKDVTLLAKFPYKQASLTVSGTARFHEFGRFVADFENQFPYSRLVNLTLEPASGINAGEKENLSFKMEIATLVKPSAS